MDKKTVRDIPVRGKRVLVRVDFNVPTNKKTGTITDDIRIRESLPTINYLIDQGSKVILVSHLGRPDGKVVDSMRLDKVAQRLSQLLGKPVKTAPDCVGPEVERLVGELAAGDVVLLENVRFHAEEEKNDPGFARQLANLADVFVNDAFGTTHRAHASTVGITAYLPSVAGFLVEKELTAMGKVLQNPDRPFASLIGGAKISDKIGFLQNLLGKVDILLIGGGMAATFFKAQGYQIGKSLVEEDRLDFAFHVMRDAKEKGLRLLLPIDVVVSDSVDGSSPSRAVAVERISPADRVVDIGPETVKNFTDELRKCRTVLWNGPMGIFEVAAFAAGTRAMSEVLASLKATTIVGGGSTAEAVESIGLAGKMTHVSTGGGASLSFLSGEVLPGIAALQDKR